MNVLSVGKIAYDITIPVDNYPVENSKILLRDRMEYSGGSACNVAFLLNKWNCETYFSGVIGYDDYGNFIKKELENNNIHTNYLETNYEKRTTMNIILVNRSNSSRTIVAVEPEVNHLRKNDFQESYDLIYSDGYEYTATTNVINRNPNAISLLGGSINNGSDEKEIMAIAKNVKYVTFSIDFAERQTKMKADFNNPQTLLNIYKELKSKLPNTNIIITLKNMGAMYQYNDEVKVMPTISVQEVDRTGAGDIFDGALAYSLWKRYDIEKAIRIANIAAGLSTTKYGVKNSMPLLSEVINYYEQRFGSLDVIEQPVAQEQSSIPVQTEQVNTASVQTNPQVQTNIQQPTMEPTQNVQTNQVQQTQVVPPNVQQVQMQQQNMGQVQQQGMPNNPS